MSPAPVRATTPTARHRSADELRALAEEGALELGPDATAAGLRAKARGLVQAWRRPALVVGAGGVEVGGVGVPATTVVLTATLEVAVHGDELRVQGLDAPAVGELVGSHGLLLHELTLVRSSLEDAFMALTADSVEYSASPAAPSPAGIAR